MKHLISSLCPFTTHLINSYACCERTSIVLFPYSWVHIHMEGADLVQSLLVCENCQKSITEMERVTLDYLLSGGPFIYCEACIPEEIQDIKE